MSRYLAQIRAVSKEKRLISVYCGCQIGHKEANMHCISLTWATLAFDRRVGEFEEPSIENIAVRLEPPVLDVILHMD